MSVLSDYARAVSEPTLSFGAPGFGTYGSPGSVANPFEGVTHYDEVVDPDGALRPAWKAIASLALSLTPGELNRVEGEIARFLADDGVTYVMPESGPQPWQLDPVPLVLDAATWGRLEVGLAQRAELLNAILSDLYGAQNLLSSGVLPPETIFAHSGFERPMARASSAGRRPLLLTGTDLGRDAQGEWHVLADRVQAPSGLGFAMQNRRVISKVLPDLYQESDAHRVDPYFQALRSALLSSVAEQGREPRVVVLSPGTHSETAFDQAFLANALGFSLVQGSDLVVRDGYVWIKPAGWPASAPVERVDVIVRRVDAEWCDPLEMRADSRLGVAGLAELVRRGRVQLVNGLGAGLLENPALFPFLPAICEALLGEQLRLPSVPTWWCGNPADRARVLARIRAGDPSLIVREIDKPRRALASLTPRTLARRIAAAPHRFVGQDVLALSQSPVWGGHSRAGANSAEARELVFRAFTLHYRSAYRPLAGGLATLRDSPDAAPTTKDVWVVKASPSDLDQGLAEIEPTSVGRAVAALAPRALEDMFWAGRYAERAEDQLRLLLTTQQQFDQAGTQFAGEASSSALVFRASLQRFAGARYFDVDEEFRALLLDRSRPGTVAHAIARLRFALEGVRDQLSGDTWRVFANVERAARALGTSANAHRIAESGGRMLSAILSLHGVTANMMRDSGWHMIEAGRYLERSLQVCQLLNSTLTVRRSTTADSEVLTALLTASESVVTHRRRYLGSVRIADALELLLIDRENPRSLAFALDALHVHLAAMPASTGSTQPERLLEDLQSTLDSTDRAALTTTTDMHRRQLEEFLDTVIDRLEKLADAIARLHFESGPPPVPLSALSLIEEWEIRP